MHFNFVAAATVATQTALAMDVEQVPAANPVPGAVTSQGCFSAMSGELQELGANFLSSGTCSQACKKADEEYTVAIIGPSKCYCSMEYPPKDALVDDENCSYSCPGYPLEACGGLSSGERESNEGYFSVWNLGVKISVPNAKGGADDGEDSKEEDGEGDKEGEGDEDEHDSSTSLGVASKTATKTASNTASQTTSTASTTPEGNDDADNAIDQTSGTASATPEASSPPEDAAAGLGLSTGLLAASAVAATVIASLL